MEECPADDITASGPWQRISKVPHLHRWPHIQATWSSWFACPVKRHRAEPNARLCQTAARLKHGCHTSLAPLKVCQCFQLKYGPDMSGRNVITQEWRAWKVVGTETYNAPKWPTHSLTHLHSLSLPLSWLQYPNLCHMTICQPALTAQSQHLS